MSPDANITVTGIARSLAEKEGIVAASAFLENLPAEEQKSAFKQACWPILNQLGAPAAAEQALQIPNEMMRDELLCTAAIYIGRSGDWKSATQAVQRVPAGAERDAVTLRVAADALLFEPETGMELFEVTPGGHQRMIEEAGKWITSTNRVSAEKWIRSEARCFPTRSEARYLKSFLPVAPEPQRVKHRHENAHCRDLNGDGGSGRSGLGISLGISRFGETEGRRRKRRAEWRQHRSAHLATKSLASSEADGCEFADAFGNAVTQPSRLHRVHDLQEVAASFDLANLPRLLQALRNLPDDDASLFVRTFLAAAWANDPRAVAEAARKNHLDADEVGCDQITLECLGA